MSDKKYNLDYYDDSKNERLVNRKREIYYKNHPNETRPERNSNYKRSQSYNTSNQTAQNHSNTNYTNYSNSRKPRKTSLTPQQIRERRGKHKLLVIRNRIIIVSIAILLLITLVTMIVATFNACSRIGNNSNQQNNTVPSTIPIETTPSTNVEKENILTKNMVFDTPNIKDTNINGYLSDYGFYVWQNTAFELFSGTENSATNYAEAISSYKQKLGNDVTVYDIVIPNHTEMGLPKRLKDTEAPTTSQADNIKNIYTKLDNSIIPINVYNALSKHCNDYIYFSSDHHWTGLGAYYAYTAFAEQTNKPSLNLDDCIENKIEGFTGSFSANISGLKTDTVSYWDLPYNVVMNVTDKFGNNVTYNSPYYTGAEAGPNTYGVFISADNPVTVLYSDSNNAETDSKIAIVKESYGNAFAPYLTYNYSEVHVIDFRHFSQNFVQYCSENGIKEVLFINGIMSANTQIRLDDINSLFY